MTKLLTKAFNKVQKLTTEEQDAIAGIILEELNSEKRWDEAFRASQDKIAQLAEEALREHRSGKSQILDPEKL
jgi:hypothetical protein